MRDDELLLNERVRKAVDDVLEQIMAEIKAMSGDIETISDVLQIIDKYKAESEGHQKMGCEGCIYEKTGNNSTYPCSHCGRCYTDKYKAESED